MNKKTFILSLATGLFLANAAFANGTEEKGKPFDISTIEYIEDEVTLDLGFDTAEYLPEGFDAYAAPTDVQSINFIDENDDLEINFNTKEHLPEGFNAFSK